MFTVKSSLQTDKWYAVYVGHNGTRLSGSDATAENLAAAFDIRLISTADNWTVGSNKSTTANWISTGYRMDSEQKVNLQDSLYSLSHWMIVDNGHVDNVAVEVWLTLKQLIELEIEKKSKVTFH